MADENKGKNIKKRTYVVQPPDYAGIAYWILVFSIGVYFAFSMTGNAKVALPFLLVFPALMGIFAILFVFPVRALTYFITEIVLRVYLFHTPKDVPSGTVVVIGKSGYFRPSFWVAPNYDTDLILIVTYLRMLGKPFSIYYEADIKALDKIMADKKIHTVYLVGHGRRHGFGIDGSTVVDYCRYDAPRYKKDFVYQVHCNGGKGKSLVEYVVPEKNHAECLPEHGLMTNMTIDQMFIDKIVEFRKYSGMKAEIVKAVLGLLAAAIPVLVFMVWTYIFFKMVA